MTTLHNNPDYLSLLAALKRYAGGYSLRIAIRISLISLLCCCTAAAIIQLLFGIVPWAIFPVLWDIACALAVVIPFSVIIYNLFIRKQLLSEVAARVEHQAHLPYRWLSMALEIVEPEANGSNDLKQLVLQTAHTALKQCPKSIPVTISRRLVVALLLSCALFAGTFAFVVPRCSSYWKLPLSFMFTNKIAVTPGSIAVPMHASVVLSCKPLNGRYPSCRCTITPLSGERRQSLLLLCDSNNVFAVRRDSLKQSFVYQFSIGNKACRPETVTVVQPPSVYSVRISMMPPLYTHIPEMQLDEGQGTFSAYRGSRVNIKIQIHGKLASASLAFSDGTVTPLSVKNSTAQGTITVRDSCRYTILLTDSLGQKNAESSQFSLSIQEDALPSVSFIAPNANKDLTPVMSENLSVEALDDIGIRSCKIVWRKNSEDVHSVHTIDILKDGGADKNVFGSITMNFRPLDLSPGDTVFYRAYARDNYPFDTTHWCVSPTFWFRVPTFEEMHEKMAAQENAAENALESARETQKSIKSSVSQLMRQTTSKQAPTWEQKQQLQEIKNQMQTQTDSITRAIESIKKTIDHLKDQGLSGSDMVQKMEQIQQALKELMQMMSDSTMVNSSRKDGSALNMQDIKESLKNIEKMLPNLSQRLDNALKYLSMIKKDRHLAELAKQAQQYGREQLDLAFADSGSKSNRDEQQSRLTKNIDSFLDVLKKQQEQGILASGNEADSMQKSLKQAEERSATLSQKQDAQMPLSLQDKTAMSGSMFELARQLGEMQQGSQSARMMKDKNTLMEMSRDARALANWQKQIMQDAQSNDSGGTTAAQQQALKKSLKKSEDKLNKLSSLPPQTQQQLMDQFNNAETPMDRVLDAMKDNSAGMGSMASSEQGLNALSRSLLKAAASMNSDGSQASGDGTEDLESALEKLSGKQSQANSLTAEMLRQMLGGSSPGSKGKGGKSGAGGEDGEGVDGASGEARRQAQSAQQAIADALEKLAGKYGNKTGEGGMAASQLSQLADEARRLQKLLDNPQSALQEKQEQFLSRMLESSLSMHRQGEGKEQRKAQVSGNPFAVHSNTNAITSSAQGTDAYYRVRQRAFAGNYPQSYRGAIKSYFDSLGVFELKGK